MYWPSPILRWMIVPADRRVHDGLRTDAVGLLKFVDLLVRAAEDAQPVAHRRQRDFGRAQVALRADEIGLRLFEVLQRAAADRLEFALPLLGSLRQHQARARLVDGGDRSDEIVVALDELTGFDGEQRRATLDQVARLGDEPADPAGIGRKDRGRGVFVDGDPAVGCALVAEGDLTHGGELEARPLRLARPEGAVGVARDLLRTRHRIARVRVERPDPYHGGGDHDSAGGDPQAVLPEARSQRGVGLRLHELGGPIGCSGRRGKLVLSDYVNLTGPCLRGRARIAANATSRIGGARR